MLVLGSDWSLQDAKLAVSSIDGSSRLSESFTLERAPKVPASLSVESDEVVRLSFVLKSASGEKLSSSELPHQVLATLTDSVDPRLVEATVIPVKPSTGKASYSLRVDRLPATFTSRTSGQADLNLVVASFGSSKPINLKLATLQLPSKLRVGGGSTLAAVTQRQKNIIKHGFVPHLERFHTFAVPPTEKMPPKIISLAAAVGTVAIPWLILVALLPSITPSLSLRSLTSSTAPLVASLVLLELLALRFWIGAGFTLFKMMPYLLGLGTLTILVGRSALGEMKRVRLGKSA
ncbi:hypothetical protein FA10DRAFT_234490 [Acaromyces ingoldii]|uniref:Ribophorin II C-terminal domain-containing protein n=1 Tax=Acaromyces ingoldii TaxID=215250 RepID=A0A316YDZ5_9BASI|nr:hypothetical protein FA10DRAFT_234490 [Acaromyces ingoldii]PWN87351.1 hypothetical protein FA10DRAFT_234490 [Acaromyces ingoldii]